MKTILRMLCLLTIETVIVQTMYANTLPDSLTTREFNELIIHVSEQGGEFHSDNLASNESSYLHPIEILRRLNISGGIYVGVGPEQNLTYICETRPEVAFIVDIRRNNMLQHLLYKTLFALSDSRAEFLSRLLSKPLYDELTFWGRIFRLKPPWLKSGYAPSILELTHYFDSVSSSKALYHRNLKQIKSELRSIGVTGKDIEVVEQIYNEFFERHLNIQYDLGNVKFNEMYPTLRDLLVATTTNGQTASFLASDESYAYVKDMHRRNLIVPVTGDFSGGKALRRIADFTRSHGSTVSVFYISNVEMYLILDNVYPQSKFVRYVENIEYLPINESSVFIRSFPNGQFTSFMSHPNRLGDHVFTTVVQSIDSLRKDNSWQSLRGMSLYHRIVTHNVIE